jgi:hypothetical protein
MRYRKGRGDGNSLMQVAAAVVGSAAASQVIPAADGPASVRHPDGTQHDPYTADDVRERERAAKPMHPSRDVIDTLQGEINHLRARIAELEQAEVTRELDVHAALNTYETPLDTPPGAEQITPSMLVAVGENGRRLISRWLPEGVWVGGCLIATREHAEALAAFITREADE